MCKIFAVLAMAFAVSSAFATNGGRGHNTTPGDGNTVITGNDNTSTNTNTSVTTINGGTEGFGGKGGKGGEGGKGGKGGSASQGQFQQSESKSSANNNGNSQSLTVNEARQRRQAPPVFAPNAFPTANCRIGHSGGVSAPGFGVSLGSSTLDEGCHIIEVSKQLWSLGLTNVAIQVMCQDAVAKKAMGPLCVDEVKEEEEVAAPGA